MKIIDGKGSLFGKINIIDFIMILLLLFSIPMFYLGWNIFTGKHSSSVYMLAEQVMRCKFIKVNPETLKLIAVGDKEVDIDGNVLGEITWVGVSGPYRHQVNFGKDEEQSIDDSVLKEIPVKIRIKTSISGSNLYYKKSQIAVDSAFEFKTAKYSITAIPLSNRMEKWVKVKVRFNGVTPELSNVINRGHLEKDISGKIIGIMSEIISIKLSQISALKMEENRLVLITDPYRTDIMAGLDILCVDKDGTLYFKNFPVKIGSQIIFSSDIYLLSGVIIEVERSEDKNAP